MIGAIHNRDRFLNRIASRLGRARMSKLVERPMWKFQPQYEILKDATTDELVEVLAEQCKVIHTDIQITDLEGLPAKLTEIVSGYGGGPIVTTKDKRFAMWGIESLFKNEWDVYEWNWENGEESISFAEKANIGIAISEMTLAESGTVVLLNNENCGRTIHFLPATYIALIPKSTIVPRMTQAAKKVRELYQESGEIPTCINFITGPSNSADIELNLVVGVHGPVKVTYILIEDL